jgi:hypothetical protein
MVDSATRLYSIVVKDAETGATLTFTAADWSADEKRLAVIEKRLAGAMVSLLRSLDAKPSGVPGARAQATARVDCVSRDDQPDCDMPLHWTVSHSAKLVVASAKGDVSEAEVQRYFFDLLAQRALPYRKLFQVGAGATTLDTLMIKHFAATMRDPKLAAHLGPLAIVVDDEDASRKARRFAAGAIAERPLRIFTEAHEARRWLDTFV